MKQSDQMKGVVFALIAVILWSGNFIVARALSGTVPPVALSFFRWGTATIILLPFAARQCRAELYIIRQHIVLLFFTALTGVTLFNTFIYIAGKYSPAMNMALIGTTAAPVFVLIISYLFLKQRVSLMQVMGTIICIIGILLLISKGHIKTLLQFKFSTGDLWILTAALSFALYTLLVRKKPKELSALAFLFSIFFLGTIILFPLLLLDYKANLSFEITKNMMLIFLYLGIGASVIAFFLWNLSIKNIGPQRTSLFGNLLPVFSTIEAALILNEKINYITVISLVIIFTGILIANASIFFHKKQLS